MTPKLNWKPNNKDLRKFGLTILIGFGIIGFWVYHRGHASAATSIWAVSSAVAFLAILVPPLSRPFYMLWMGVAFLMGSVMSRVIMSIIFIGVLTPVALVFRIIKRDALNKRKNESAQTYWAEHPVIEDKNYYKHLF